MYEGNCVSMLVCRVLEVKSCHRPSYLGLVARGDCQSENLEPWSVTLLSYFYQVHPDVQEVDHHWRVIRISFEERLPAFSVLSTETLSSCSQPMTALAFWLY